MNLTPNKNRKTSGIKDQLSRVSSGPGVYLMKDTAGTIIYIGKARNLKKRLASYFIKPVQPDIKTSVLVKKIERFDTIVTISEKEALILESNLIKRYKPRYNVFLKDDKRYPSIRLDTTHPYPNLTIVRKIKKDGSMYFGPFVSSAAVQQTLKMINKTFKLRKCHTSDFKTRTRPCLNSQMQRCLAPCCNDIDRDVYGEIVREVILFLKGSTCDLIQKVKKEMISAADNQDYETATMLRDKMFALEKTVEKQVVVSTDFIDRDVIGIAGSHELTLITVLIVRGGVLVGTRNFVFCETLSSHAETIGIFIRQYYEKEPFIPQEILTPMLVEDSALIEEWLKSIKGKKVSILWPRRGEKAKLMAMADRNADIGLKEEMASLSADRKILARLQKKIKINRLPKRIECFDNSNISGKEPVAGMVVFENGKSKKSAYRRYAINTVSKHNDYAYMNEVLRRRYGKGEKSKPFPDLLVVDGGKGQLNIAVSVVKDLNLEGRFDIIGIAKKDEKRGEVQDKIYKPGRVNPVNFAKQGDLLLFLQRVRDEAHRFAISFHRKRRGKTSMRSVLDTIPGIGKKRKQILLRHFKSITKIRSASIEELSAVPGISYKTAESVASKLGVREAMNVEHPTLNIE
ncbi:MAG: excinuclease ABC subunit UvrC [Thermodesulfobacteriota bacterium]|nr:excinuclease ABC subunit UvrC [Thermodesulfobacteriota bacterium]